jgi:NAD(P)-dependent dehydrogenase (short-subunit alcohol dehydrogenase family)
MTGLLNNKNILITGSARGIGAGIARAVRAAGGTPILHGRTASDNLKQLASSLGARWCAFDVADREETVRAIAELRRSGEFLSGVVTSAGIVSPKPFSELRRENDSQELNVNLWGTINSLQATIPWLKEQPGGRIVTVSSIRATPALATARGPLYAASKAGVEAVTIALAKELAPDVLVNGVAPGFTATDMAQTWSESAWAQARSNLMQRPAEVSEIASAVVFLLSSMAAGITGTILQVDGGYRVAGK